jgi:hypothetical protein
MPMQRTRTHLLAWFIFSISTFILNESNLVHLNNSFLYSQELQSTLILQKGDSWLEIQPGEKVYIRSYRKSLFGKRVLTDIPQRKIIASGPKTKPTTFISINHQQKVLITESDAIALSDFYSIAPLSGSTMALKTAKNGVIGGFCGGFALSVVMFIGAAEVGSDETLSVILLSSFIGGITAVYGGIFGLIGGFFTPDITEEFIVGPDEWSIVEQ